MSVSILVGDVCDRLAQIASDHFDCVVTSPPYFGLRDYDDAGQIGLEATPKAYVDVLVGVFREVRRVLRPDGTLWLNLGDSYAGSWGAQGKRDTPGEISRNSIRNHPKRSSRMVPVREDHLKPKDLIGIPWRVAFALQADGWYLRQDIIWAKPNPMPESVTDRCTKAHEYLFLLSRSEQYFYDAAAVAEAAAWPAGPGNTRAQAIPGQRAGDNANLGGSVHKIGPRATRNKRDVWSIRAEPFAEAHFATFPPALVEPCILAGSRPGAAVLDPFGGAGTTGLVASRLGRDCTLIELNPSYAAMAQRRIKSDMHPCGGADEAAGLDVLPLFRTGLGEASVA